MLAETAALRLGTTVANAAARLWLGSRKRDQERALSMEELVRVRVSGVRLQREVRQQFEQVTNAVFDRLEPFLKHAFQRLGEGGRQAVVDAVADTLAQADFSDEVLLAANVNPAVLVRSLTRSVKVPVGFNEAETRLYEILISECVEYYVRIVRSLPVFEERASAELLARTTTLGAEVTRVLERLPDRSLFAPDGTDQDTAFSRKYLDLVIRDLDEVELFRRTSDQATAPRLRLSVAYVSLRTTGDSNGKRHPSTRSLVSLRPDMSRWEESGSESSGMRVETALSGASRVLLRGEAGSGKTTLLRWLAITAARGAFTGELADWNGLVPIVIKLREYSGTKPPNPEAMLDGVAGSITGIMPRGWVERQLDGGNALLLIDGVDELLDRERRWVREWLRKLLRQYDQVRVVVTSRPAAASADWLRREDFTALFLDRMTPPDLAAFVRQWHRAVGELGSDLPCLVEELPQYEQSLLVSLKDRAHLQSLAGTPLLASMLCAMHLNRGRQLPRDRMELYRNALDTLVHDRDADRNVPSAVESELSLGDKLVILRDIAWRLSDNGRTEIDLNTAAGHVTAKLRAMRHLDALNGHQILDQLRHRSGILRSPAEGRMDFVHRTFQEYLAAQEAAEEDRIGNLVSRAHLDLWRETIIMTAGHANTRQREELLGEILDRAEAEPRHARTLRLLAASCQETLPSVSDELAERLDDAVRKLLPARRQTDPPSLAAVGASLLRWLPRSLKELTKAAAVRTVETVAMIGGGQALELLAGYVGDQREDVVYSLIDAWSYFDADEYADKILSRLSLARHYVPFTHSGQLRAVKKLHSLSCVRMNYPSGDLDFLAEFPPLDRLSIGPFNGGDLSILRTQSTLKALDMLGSRMSRDAVSILADLPELEGLGFDFSEDFDLDLLRLIPSLKRIQLFRIVEGAELSPLASLSALRFLNLHTIKDGIPGPMEFAGMVALENLILQMFDASVWFMSLKSFPPSLSRLSLNRCIAPADIHFYRKFEKLEFLSLYKCETPDGAPITGLDIPGVKVRINRW